MSLAPLRLLADDLTGALDTAAEWTTILGPLRVTWDDTAAPGESAALVSGTREATRDAAIARTRALAPALAGGKLAYKKVDSLLRGHVAAELAACLSAGPWRHCIVAPAFPAMGRITREGRLLVREPGASPSPARANLLAALVAEGVAARLGRPDAALEPGVTVLDAESEDDLAGIVAVGRWANVPLLWCGSGGLARALAQGAQAPSTATLASPVLGLFGSDQAVTARQLAACGPLWHRLADSGDTKAAARLGRALDTRGAALASIDLQPGLPRTEAARRIEVALGELTHGLPPPGTLIAAGGETLLAILRGLGASALCATGLVAPGVPRSVILGGAWDGVAVVSKSGAFGGDTLWRDLLAGNGLFTESIDA